MSPKEVLKALGTLETLNKARNRFERVPTNLKDGLKYDWKIFERVFKKFETSLEKPQKVP